MPRIRNAIQFTLCLPLVIGCNNPSHDERLDRLVQVSIEQQARQNDAIARQSEAVVEESSRVTEAASNLVAKDAEARKQLIAAQHQLASEQHGERSRIDQDKRDLEQERRELAKSRHREPILAATIQGLGILMVAVLPLIVCIYSLRLLYSIDTSDEVAVAELLLNEFTSHRPLLMPEASSSPPNLNGANAAGVGLEPISNEALCRSQQISCTNVPEEPIP